MLRHYHVAESRSMRTLWLLNELAIPFENVELPLKLAGQARAVMDAGEFLEAAAHRLPAVA